VIALLLSVLAETNMLRPEPKLQDQDRDRSETDLVKTAVSDHRITLVGPSLQWALESPE